MFSSGSVLTASATFADLWHDSKLRGMIHRLACKHGGSIEDIEDAEGEAWARLSRLPMGMGVEEYRREARRGIYSEYHRRHSIEKMEICNGIDERQDISHGRMRGRYAGTKILARPCRGAHGTLCTAILTFEIAAAMEHENSLWLGGEEYERLRAAADAEADDGLAPEE